jgi:hypothetical protein
MSFFSDLLGKSSAKAANQLGQRSMARTNEGYDSASGFARQGYDASVGRLNPFLESSSRGYNMLADSYGLNGADARTRAYDTYASDPFNQHSGQVTQNALGNIMRTAASRGVGNSGATQLAMSRAGLEAQDRRIADWRGGLGQFGNQAVSLAGTMAGLDQGYYGGEADRAVARANALNQTDANATMAASNARMAGVNNLLSGIGNIAGFAVQGFAPGAKGASTFGNIRNAFTGQQWS